MKNNYILKILYELLPFSFFFFLQILLKKKLICSEKLKLAKPFIRNSRLSIKTSHSLLGHFSGGASFNLNVERF